jgi:hypothetical protein
MLHNLCKGLFTLTKIYCTVISENVCDSCQALLALAPWVTQSTNKMDYTWCHVNQGTKTSTAAVTVAVVFSKGSAVNLYQCKFRLIQGTVFSLQVSQI